MDTDFSGRSEGEQVSDNGAELGEHSCLLDGPDYPEEAISQNDADAEAAAMAQVDSLKELDNG